jgi:hypothetical protein
MTKERRVSLHSGASVISVVTFVNSTRRITEQLYMLTGFEGRISSIRFDVCRALTHFRKYLNLTFRLDRNRNFNGQDLHD